MSINIAIINSSCSFSTSNYDKILIYKVSNDIINNDVYILKMVETNISYSVKYNGLNLKIYSSDDCTLYKTYNLRGIPISWTYLYATTKNVFSKEELSILFVYTYKKLDSIILSCIRSPTNKIDFIQYWEIQTKCSIIINSESIIDRYDEIYLQSDDKLIYQVYNYKGKNILTKTYNDPILLHFTLAYDGSRVFSLINNNESYYLHPKKSIEKAFFLERAEGYGTIDLYDGDTLYRIDYLNKNVISMNIKRLNKSNNRLNFYLSDDGIYWEYIDNKFVKVANGLYDNILLSYDKNINNSISSIINDFEFGTVVFGKFENNKFKILILDVNRLMFSFDSNYIPKEKYLKIYRIEDIPANKIEYAEINTLSEPYMIFHTNTGEYRCDVPKSLFKIETIIDDKNDFKDGIYLKGYEKHILIDQRKEKTDLKILEMKKVTQ